MLVDEKTMLLIWLGIVILTLIIEIITQGLTTIWFSIGATVAAVMTVWDVSIWWQIGVFVVVSVIVMLLVRPIAKRWMSKAITPTNVDQLLHEEALVIEEINNSANTGRVRLRDVDWVARADDEAVIPVNAVVSILRIDGVKLIVKKK
ncbi:MAG: NfeD family protein [Eubacterium sp.]|nr:NfeD family protein [Eubacterium sp.]